MLESVVLVAGAFLLGEARSASTTNHSSTKTRAS